MVIMMCSGSEKEEGSTRYELGRSCAWKVIKMEQRKAKCCGIARVVVELGRE